MEWFQQEPASSGMSTRVIESSDQHEIRFVEFLDMQGRTITSYFQVISLPEKSLGCFDYIEDARMTAKAALILGAPLLEIPLSVFYRQLGESATND